VANKKKTRDEIASEMASLIVEHLEAMQLAERKNRVEAFKSVLLQGNCLLQPVSPPKIRRAN
jgi:hypothetical protein